MIISVLFPFLSLFIGFLSASSDEEKEPSSKLYYYSNQDKVDIVIRNLHRLLEENKNNSYECADFARKVIISLGSAGLERFKDDPEFVGPMGSIVRINLNEGVLEMHEYQVKLIRELSITFIEKIRIDSVKLLYFWYVYDNKHCDIILPKYSSQMKRMILVINAERVINNLKGTEFNASWLENASKLNRHELVKCLQYAKQTLLATEN
jgi:hypothetical protein